MITNHYYNLTEAFFELVTYLITLYFSPSNCLYLPPITAGNALFYRKYFLSQTLGKIQCQRRSFLDFEETFLSIIMLSPLKCALVKLNCMFYYGFNFKHYDNVCCTSVYRLLSCAHASLHPAIPLFSWSGHWFVVYAVTLLTFWHL